MSIAILIAVMIAVVVGVNFIGSASSPISNITSSLNATDTGAKVLISILPIIFVVVIILGAVAWIGGRDKEMAEEKETEERYNWRAFGNRLKAAYSAKFGGDNKGFDEEVDIRIRGMEALGKGYTKSIEMQWLKSMSQMVEIPWAIPEEEHLAETDKTREFEKASNLTEKEREAITGIANKK